MTLKTSLFNKAIFKSDIKRFWWIGVLETIMLLLVCVMPVYDTCVNHGSGFGGQPNWEIAFLIPLIFGVGTSVTLFSYLNSSAPVSTIHSYPVTRTEIFVTKLVSGCVLMVVPLVINTIIFVLMSVSPMCAGSFYPIDAFVWMGVGLIYTCIMFSLATFTAMVSGSSIATLIFTVGFSLLPLFFYGLFDLVFSHEIYGYSQLDMDNIIMSNIYIGPYGLEKGEMLWNYPVASVILLTAAYFLYRIRKLESHGEVISFKWLKPVFIAIIASLASGVSYEYFREFMDIKNIFTIIPLGILGCGISYMIAKKSIDFKGASRAIGIYILGAVLFIAGVKFDVTGYEKRIPKSENIKNITVTIPNGKYNQNYHYRNMNNLCTFTKEDGFEGAIKAHSEFISKKKAYENAPYTVEIKYLLKNGSYLVRSYPFDDEKDADTMRKIVETDGFRRTAFCLLYNADKEYISASFHDRRKSNPDIFYPDSGNMKKIIDAVKKDMISMPYEEFFAPRTSSAINIEWHQKNADGDKITINEELYLSDKTVHTNRVLREILGDNMYPSAEDMESVDVLFHTPEPGQVVTVTVTDAETITKLYKLYNSMVIDNRYENYENITIAELSYKMKNGHIFHVSCNYSEEDMPQVFKELRKKAN